MHGLDRRIAFTRAVVARWSAAAPVRILLSSTAASSAVHLDVDQQHRDDRDDVPDRALDRRATCPRGRLPRQPRFRRLRDGADAHHVVRRVDRRHGHADRHAAQPDRHRHAAAELRRRADLVLPVDGARRADLVDGPLRRCSPRGSASPARAVFGCPRTRADLVRRELRQLGPLSAAASATCSSPSALTVVLWVLPGLLAIAGLRRVRRSRRAYDAVDARGGRRDDRRDPAVRPAGQLAARRFTLSWEEAVRIDWGIDPPVRRRPGARVAGVLDRAGRQHRPRHHARGCRRTAPLPFTILFTASRPCCPKLTSNTASANMIVPVAIAVAAGGRHQSDRAGARRDARRQRGLHDADLDAAERDRLQLGPRADRHDDSVRRRPVGGGVLIVIATVSLLGPLLF